MDIKITKLEIRTKILTDKKTKAIISVDFGAFVIKGFRVLESQFTNDKGDMLWLVPPSYLGGGRYHPIFFMPDKKLWEELQKLILDNFYKQREEHNKKMIGLSDEEWDAVNHS